MFYFVMAECSRVQYRHVGYSGGSVKVRCCRVTFGFGVVSKCGVGYGKGIEEQGEVT